MLGLIFFLSLMVHEYGHALAAKKFGKEAEITLEGIGGFTIYDARGMSEGQQFAVTLCGPIFTALLAGLGFYLLKSSPWGGAKIFFWFLMRLNLYWLIVNLAPLMPLDGGRIALFGLKKWLGDERGEQVSLWIGNATAVAGLAYFLMGENYLFAGLFLFHGWKNHQLLLIQRGKGRKNPFSIYNEAVSAAEREDLEKAKRIFSKLAKSKDEYIRVRAAVGLANVLERMGKGSKAIEVLEKAGPEKLDHGKLLLCKLAYAAGNFRLVEKFSIETYEMHPTFDVALLNAKAFAKLGNGVFAAAWLGTSLQFSEGRETGATIVADRAFDSVREHPDFQKAIEGLITTT